MNLASWIILGVVVLIAALAARATFKKAKHGGCCGSDGSPAAGGKRDDNGMPLPGFSCEELGCGGSCQGCSACEGSATSRNALQPVVKPVQR